jgi:hypothetical protein
MDAGAIVALAAVLVSLPISIIAIVQSRRANSIAQLAGGQRSRTGWRGATQQRPRITPARPHHQLVQGVANAVFQPALQLSYTVTINASGPFGPLEPLTYTIDLNDIKWSRVAAATGTLYGVTRAVKDLGKTIKEITKNRPATDLADHKDHGDDREHDH